MSLAATIPALILDTILGRLALLFLTAAGGDLAAARHAAAQMLADYHPETQDELRLAAEIISFSFHALEALGQAASPGIPLNHTLRLRGSAVSLNRAAHKAQRRLDQLRKARHTATPAATNIPEPAVDQPQPKIDKALNLIEVTRDTLTEAKATGQTWTQAFQQRQRAKRIAENLKKNKAIQAQSANAASSADLSPVARKTAPLPYAGQ
jgi:hypothetical protein